MSLLLFDRNFDQEIAREEEAAAAAAAPSAEAIAQMIEAARAEGHAAGRAEGRAEGIAQTMAEMEARRSLALETMMPQIAALHDGAATHRAALEAESLDFALSLCEQLFPKLLEAEGNARCADEIRHAIRLALGSPSLRVTMSPDLHAEIGPALEEAAVATGLAYVPELVADPQMQTGQMRAEWLHGTVEFSYASTCARILDALRTARSSLGQTPTPNASMPRD